ncbi:MAG: threonylcarbamoyl-AMP synthase [Bacteroidetes bacterium]|nr:MAG: threonylcarbamoyl-AMP synthase [Bacteroidota bacterium]
MIGTDITKASTLLNSGQLVAIPTETVYGLAGNALDPEAISNIYKVKNRPHFNPLILHLPNIESARKYVLQFPKEAEKLAKSFWPGPLSILLPKSKLVPDLITAGSTHVVLRVPNHTLTLDLLNTLDFPLAAPSANISNTVSPTTAEHVEQGLGSEIPYILDGGTCQIGLESTIVAIENGLVVILREGGISQEQITKETDLSVQLASSNELQSPGQLSKHYSTTKPLHLVSSIKTFLEKYPHKKCCALLFENKRVNCKSYLLSNEYNLSEIANNLFSLMRIADQDDSDCIIVEHIKQEGIGRAIADRLNRSASTF